MTSVDPASVPVGVRWHWWRMFPVRAAVAVLLLLAGLDLLGDLPKRPELHWRPFSGDVDVSVTPHQLGWVVVIVLFVLLMPATSYRRHDVLLFLVPVYGMIVAAKVLCRAMSLPRRDWSPRPDEIPRAVRIPGGAGDYFLARDFAEAEHYRGRWCVNPTHRHPYGSWAMAQQVRCHHDAARLDRDTGRARSSH